MLAQMTQWHIDQEEGMPAVDFVGSSVILTFGQMPTLAGLDRILEVTEASVREQGLTVEVRLPDPGE